MGGQQPHPMDKASLEITLALKALGVCNRLLLVTDAEPVLLMEEIYAEEQW